MRRKIIFAFVAIILGILNIANASVISPYKEIKIIVTNDTDLATDCEVSFDNGRGSWKPGFAFPAAQGFSNLPAKAQMQGIVESDNLYSTFTLYCNTFKNDHYFSAAYWVSMSPEGGMVIWGQGSHTLKSHIYPEPEAAMIDLIMHLDAY